MTHDVQESALSASGRFGRFSYLAWNCLLAGVTITGILSFVLLFPDTFVQLQSGHLGTGLLFIGLIYIAIFYFTFVFNIRRLHDRNHTGWLSLLMLLPLVNVLLILYLMCAPGDTHANSYGAPRPTAGWETVLAWLYIVFAILAMVAILALPNVEQYI